MIWRPYATAPKDGTPVWLCDKHGDSGGPWPMFWNARGRNELFQPGCVGIWELDGGGMTWTDERPDGAPEWWAPRTSAVCPSPPWERQH